MKVTVISIVVGVLGTVPRGLEKDWRIRKSKEESRPSRSQHCKDFSERAPANVGVKNSQESDIIIIIIAVPTDHRIKLKESEKKVKYLDLARELKKTMEVKVRSPDGDTEYFDIVAGVLQGDTLAPYLFIICLDYVLRT